MESDDRDRREMEEEIAALRRELARLEAEATRAKRLEEEARREHEQLLAILESIDEIIYVSDPHTHEVLYANRALKRRLGRDPTGGLCYREFQGRDTPCEFCTNPIILADPEAPYYWEYRNPLLCRDFFILDRIIRWPDGRKVRFELALDVTERKEVEHRLRALESELVSIYQAAPIGIGMVSFPDRVILRVNPRLCQMLGYREEELVGKNARLLYPSEDEYLRVGEEKYRELEKKGAGSIETKWVSKSGRVLDILLSSTFLDPDNPTAGSVFTALDVTELRRVREYRERVDEVILGLGADAMENVFKILEGAREVLSCDHAAYITPVRGRVTVLSTLPGEEGLLILPEGSEADMLCAGFLRGERREPWAVEDLSRVPGAEKDSIISHHAFGSCLLLPVVTRGKVTGCMGVYTKEVRGWSRAEVEAAETLAQALSLERERLQREEELKDFIDVASHELRHPVTVIKGYAVTLRERWGALDEESRHRFLDALEQGADRLARVAGMLLDVSRLERGQFLLKKEEMDPLALAEEAVEEMRERGFANRFRVSSPSGKWRLKADRERIHQVICILLENAVLYSPPGSEVEVELREDNGFLCVSVLDRGVGIPEEQRERVFERFYQVEEAIHHSVPGMGMGLYIAREIVEGHGGRIWNERRPGGGTAFRFTLPLVRRGGQS
ncbi:MAG: ATP-binding protein [Actinomycetota bacterium]